MRRLLWVAVGATATVVALRTAREVTEKHVPAGARSAVGAVAALGGVLETVRHEFAAGTAQREAELRSALLAGADLDRARSAVDAWRTERAGRAEQEAPPAGAPEAGATASGTAASGTATPGTTTPGTTTTSGTADAAVPGRPRPGSAAAARGSGARRAEDPDDGPTGYSFF